ncbi:hypothetical protein C0J29_25050 [Mycobacterium paragordonae]|nr:hypothetical protein C0J29_25050 [Mycobacterium paragordonae]
MASGADRQPARRASRLPRRPRLRRRPVLRRPERRRPERRRPERRRKPPPTARRLARQALAQQAV